VSIKRSFQGLFIAIKTVRIIKELVEIWPNKVCDIWCPPLTNSHHPPERSNSSP